MHLRSPFRWLWLLAIGIACWSTTVTADSLVVAVVLRKATGQTLAAWRPLLDRLSQDTGLRFSPKLYDQIPGGDQRRDGGRRHRQRSLRQRAGYVAQRPAHSLPDAGLAAPWAGSPSARAARGGRRADARRNGARARCRRPPTAGGRRPRHRRRRLQPRLPGNRSHGPGEIRQALISRSGRPCRSRPRAHPACAGCCRADRSA